MLNSSEIAAVAGDGSGMDDGTIGVISAVCTTSDEVIIVADDGSNVSGSTGVVVSVCTVCATSDEIIITAAEGSKVSGNTVVFISVGTVCATSNEVVVVVSDGSNVSESSLVVAVVSDPTVCTALEVADKNRVENKVVNVKLSNCCISEELSVTVTVRLYTFISAEVVVGI